ncbi:hypothetical protein NW752_006906 [Fusarium irregulare]|uniref:Uncharacterized protein n=1 Tax=Fusarium irregulare TaxID=2494466 RepID=A0A9W8PTT3_9HYPO|nr:hypothetical protein NW766_005786 [Fusarium irregulare]KAJ4015973.1 hypothetical protein NW752_006906 [Fusarium irregulare]
MASEIPNTDPSKVKLEDVAGRRKIIQSYFQTFGWTNEKANQELHELAVESVCNEVHAKGRAKISHVFFEYIVDHTMWQEFIRRRSSMGLYVVGWPWPKRPDPDDKTLGISPTYYEWLQKNGHKLPEDATPLSAGDLASRLENVLTKDPRLPADKPVEQLQFSSHHLRLKLWHSIMGDGPYKTPIVGPFEVALPPSLDFHGLVRGEDGEIYKELCSTIHDFLTVGWLVKDGRPVSLVVGFKATHEEHAKKHKNCHDLVMLWGDCLTWVSGLNDGSSLTLVESLSMSDWQRIAAVRDAELPGHTSSHLDNEVNSDPAK